jgi:bifunctional non-homologous end joining protein LigD
LAWSGVPPIWEASGFSFGPGGFFGSFGSMPSRFFDLIELDGGDLRREPIESRKAALLKLLRKSDYGIFLNEHVDDEAAIVFQHACKLGLEGIVSKRRGSPYVSGRSPHWLKLKNPNSAAVRCESDEEWG